jgi:hypothetical protein
MQEGHTVKITPVKNAWEISTTPFYNHVPFSLTLLHKKLRRKGNSGML